MTDEKTITETFLTTDQVTARYSISRSALFHWRKTAPGFPAPIKLNGTSPRWRLSELEQWEAQQVEG